MKHKHRHSLIRHIIQNLNPKFFRLEYQISDNSFNLSKEGTYDSVDIPSNIKDFINALEISHKEETFNYLNDIYQKLAI